MPIEQQLLERATAPGDSYWYRGECIRRPYAPVNVCKDDWTFDFAMTQPDTPDIAALRLDGKLSWFLLGKRGVSAAVHQ